jgi:hypothetical protein
MALVSAKGILIATTVAGLVGCATSGGSSAGGATTKTGEPVQCSGINACKGQGSCHGNENACKAKNDCKGKGWVEAPSAEDCTAKGGTVIPKSG